MRGRNYLVTWRPEGHKCRLLVLADEIDGSDATNGASRATGFPASSFASSPASSPAKRCTSYLLDVRGGVWKLNSMRWPNPLNEPSANAPYSATEHSTEHSRLLLEGELVHERESVAGGNTTSVWRMLLTDALVIDDSTL
eukprot:3661805-Pleurochrysis_carterae.AAC.1